MPESSQAHLHLEFSPGNDFHHKKNSRKSCQAHLQLELSEEIHHHLETKNRSNTNSFADLTRVED
eukprot:6391471-Pyramimonas_sp.AAC.1